jgi:hypothetical protein
MKLYDLARMTVSGTPGTSSTINLLAAATGGYLTFAQAQVPDGAKLSYSISDGSNLEVGRATYNSAGPSLSNRAPLLVSGGGQSPLSLTSAAVVGIVSLSQDFEEELPPLTQLLGTNNSNVAEVESTRALRASLWAMTLPRLDQAFTINRYAIGAVAQWSPGTAALSASLFAMFGMPISAGLALVNKFQITMVTSAIVGARNGNVRIDLRQYDNTTETSGVGIQQQGDGSLLRQRNSYGSPLMTIWASANAGLAAALGPNTISPILIASVQGPGGQAVGTNIPLTTMIDAYSGGGYSPLVLQPRNGVGMEAQVPAAVTSQTLNWAYNLVWDEYIPNVDGYFQQ